jgi:hypothetical protein
MKRVVPPLSLEELRSALLAGAAAAEANTPREPLADPVPIDLDQRQGAAYQLADAPIIRFIRAIDESFSHAPEKKQAAIERVLLVGRETMRDRRASPYLQRPSAGVLQVHQSLLEAIASVPLCYGDPSPLDQIFDLAERLRQRLNDAQPPEEADA